MQPTPSTSATSASIGNKTAMMNLFQNAEPAPAQLPSHPEEKKEADVMIIKYVLLYFRG